ncbi:MAG: hypothetical protein QW348_08275 [Ignisphaera sp.]
MRMNLSLCLSSTVSKSGVVVAYEIYTSDEACKNIRDMVEKLPPEQLISIAKEHGGCTTQSENPLVIVTKDGRVKVVLRPGNMMATAFWRMIVSILKQQCG